MKQSYSSEPTPVLFTVSPLFLDFSLRYQKGQHEENDNHATQESNKDTNKTAMIRKFSEYTKLVFTEKLNFFCQDWIKWIEFIQKLDGWAYLFRVGSKFKMASKPINPGTITIEN